jgi:uncharacterized OB-fold protein
MSSEPPVPQRVPAVDGLFTWPSEHPALLASLCTSCGTASFPALKTCNNPRCRDNRVERVTLATEGTLWSYTVHHYRPPPPFPTTDAFQPYAVGVVALSHGLKVLGLLTTTDPAALRIGAPFQVVVAPLETDAGGVERLTWKFAPKGAGHA